MRKKELGVANTPDEKKELRRRCEQESINHQNPRPARILPGLWRKFASTVAVLEEAWIHLLLNAVPSENGKENEQTGLSANRDFQGYTLDPLGLRPCGLSSRITYRKIT